MNKDTALRLALEALESNRRTHHYCEDTWYSCPKHEDGCANDSEGDECNCGADKANAGIDQAITAIKAALEAKDEPVAYGMWDTMIGKGNRMMYVRLGKGQDGCTVPLYTTPPQRKPLTDEEIDAIVVDEVGLDADADEMHNFARAIEAAHGIKEEA
jgi:hypothetical protein